jgi:hypothetical protein
MTTVSYPDSAWAEGIDSNGSVPSELGSKSNLHELELVIGDPNLILDNVPALFHVQASFNFLWRRLKNKREDHQTIAGEFIRNATLQQVQEDTPHAFATAVHVFALSAAFAQSVDNIIVQLISQTNEKIAYKYEQNFLIFQNTPNQALNQSLHTLDHTPHTLIMSTSQPVTVFCFPDPFSILSNEFSLPVPTDPSVLVLFNETYCTQIDTLAFLWAGFQLGDEHVHPMMLIPHLACILMNMLSMATMSIMRSYMTHHWFFLMPTWTPHQSRMEMFISYLFHMFRSSILPPSKISCPLHHSLSTNQLLSPDLHPLLGPRVAPVHSFMFDERWGVLSSWRPCWGDSMVSKCIATWFRTFGPL